MTATGLAGIGIALLLATKAPAATVTVNLTGALSGFTAPADFVANLPVGVGASMTATWVYESSTPSIPFGPGFLFVNPTLSFTVDVGSGALVMSYNGATGGLTVANGLSFPSGANYLNVSDHDFNGTTGSVTGT